VVASSKKANFEAKVKSYSTVQKQIIKLYLISTLLKWLFSILLLIIDMVQKNKGQPNLQEVNFWELKQFFLEHFWKVHLKG
jgi:hypothetical protein